MNDLAHVLRVSEMIPGWIQGPDAQELMRVSYSLRDGAVIVEIGTFFGRSTVLLAGPRRVRGTGKVHCIDPFDCTGDDFSVPHYQRIMREVGGGSLRAHFEENMRRAGLVPWVDIHQGRAADVAATWTMPIDLLLLDGDQSPKGAREAYESWISFLRPGGMIVLRNSAPGNHAAGHDGHRRLAVEEIVPPHYVDIRLVRATTFARKAEETE